MTLSDSWDTPPSNPNNRRSSVLRKINGHDTSHIYNFFHIFLSLENIPNSRQISLFSHKILTRFVITKKKKRT